VNSTTEYLLIPLLLAFVFAVIGCGQGETGEAPFGQAEDLPVAPAEDKEIVLIVVYDNNPFLEGLETSWGFSCLIEGCEKTVLFDTGGDGDILLYNMSRLGIDPERIDAVVISHGHGDHTGGLARLLEANPDLEVYLLTSFSSGLKDSVRSYGSSLIEVLGPRPICDGIWTTGEIGSGIREQALVVETDAGSLTITGCAHPGIVEMVRAAETVSADGVALVLGGFHLGSSSGDEIDRIIAELKALGVRHVGPCHCTEDKAMESLRDAYGDGFIKVGVGKQVDTQELE